MADVGYESPAGTQTVYQRRHLCRLNLDDGAAVSADQMHMLWLLEYESKHQNVLLRALIRECRSNQKQIFYCFPVARITLETKV